MPYDCCAHIITDHFINAIPRGSRLYSFWMSATESCTPRDPQSFACPFQGCFVSIVFLPILSWCKCCVNHALQKAHVVRASRGTRQAGWCILLPGPCPSRPQGFLTWNIITSVPYGLIYILLQVKLIRLRNMLKIPQSVLELSKHLSLLPHSCDCQCF